MNPSEITELTDRLPQVEELGPGRQIAEIGEIAFRDASFHGEIVKKQIVYVAGISHGRTFGDAKKRLGFSAEAYQAVEPFSVTAGPLTFKALDDIIGYRTLKW